MLQSTKFADSPIISCAACVGGERVAAVSDVAAKAYGSNKRAGVGEVAPFSGGDESSEPRADGALPPVVSNPNNKLLGKSIGLDSLLSV